MSGSDESLDTIFLHTPFLEALVDALPPITFITLSRAIPLFKERCEKVLNTTETSHFEKHLDLALHKIADAQCDCLHGSARATHCHTAVTRVKHALKHKAHWITGSFMLDVLTGDMTRLNDVACDIDIVTRHCLDSAGNTLRSVLEARDIRRLNSNEDVEKIDYGDCVGICNIRNYNWGTKPVQFIEIVHETVRPYLESFDMSFLKNAYGGGGELIVMNPDAVATRTCYVSAAVTHFKRLKTITPTTTYNLFKRALNRMCKYKDRGYTISFGGFSVAYTGIVWATDPKSDKYEDAKLLECLRDPDESNTVLKGLTEQEFECIVLWNTLWREVAHPFFGKYVLRYGVHPR